MTIMGYKTRIIFIIGLLLQLQGSSQIDNDESRPYEFSFTIDGEQHRYEKKDVQGIIQGEFGFITGDGIYHVTVYATDENGSFKILSMKNVRVSGPLDGSNVDIKNIQDELILKYTDKPISRPEIKYTNKPFGISETKSTSKSSYYKPETTTLKPQIITSQNINRYDPQIYTTTQRSAVFKITTVSTIRPGCGGCGIIARTTPKTKPLQTPIQFSNNNKPDVNPAFPRPLSLLPSSSKPNYGSNYDNTNPNNINPEPYETTTKSSLHYNYNFENHAKPESPKPPVSSDNNYYGNSNYKPESYSTTVKPSSSGNNNYVNNNYKPESYSTTVKPSSSGNNNLVNNNYKPESYSTTVKPLLGNNNFKPQTYGTTTTTKPSSVLNNNNYYDTSSKAPFYNPTSTPELFTSKIETSTKRGPSNYNAVQFEPLTPTKIHRQENKNVYPSPQKPLPLISDIKTENGNIYVPGNSPIPIKDKYPNMKEGLPDGITESDIVGILYKFNYTVGFHGHYEKGWRNGTKTGGYFVNGRDGYSRIVTYVADENGYRPKFRLVHLGYDSPDTPKADSEKKFGLKNFEFVWYPLN